MYHTARLVLAFVKSAVRKGATAANSTQALKFLWSGNRVIGVRARDVAEGREFDLRAKLSGESANPSN